MRKKSILIMLLLLATATAGAQQERELLQEVDSAYADRLTAYNSAFLQKTTYTAARYRIVKPNPELLINEVDISITPFADEGPIRISPIEVRREIDSVHWSGRVEPENPTKLPEGIDPFVEELPPTAHHASLSMYRWDLDVSGNAHLSRTNRFEFSPNWIFDQLDNPILKPGGPGILNEEGARPPQTPEEVARHKALLQLQKHAFGSVSADFLAPSGTHYMLVPLEYTPQYSVIIEEDPNLKLPVSMNDLPGGNGNSTLTADERRRVQQYRDFVQRLPREENKPVKGDLE